MHRPTVIVVCVATVLAALMLVLVPFTSISTPDRHRYGSFLVLYQRDATAEAWAQYPLWSTLEFSITVMGVTVAAAVVLTTVLHCLHEVTRTRQLAYSVASVGTILLVITATAVLLNKGIMGATTKPTVGLALPLAWSLWHVMHVGRYAREGSPVRKGTT